MSRSEQWYNEFHEVFKEFVEAVGLDEAGHEAFIVLWMGWITRDTTEISEITKIDKERVDFYANRAIKFKIWSDNMTMKAGEWPGFKEGSEHDEAIARTANINLMVDCLCVSGMLDVDLSGEEPLFSIAAPFDIGDKVRSVSGRGAAVYVANIRMKNGIFQIKNTKTKGRTTSTGEWKPADSFMAVA